jgi:hypothetical protein
MKPKPCQGSHPPPEQIREVEARRDAVRASWPPEVAVTRRVVGFSPSQPKHCEPARDKRRNGRNYW